MPDLWAHQTHPESAGGVALEALEPSPALLGEVQNPGVYSPPDQGHGPQALILPACPAPSPPAPGKPPCPLKPGVQRQALGAQPLWPPCLSHPRCLCWRAEKVRRPAPQLSHSLLTPEPQAEGRGLYHPESAPGKHPRLGPAACLGWGVLSGADPILQPRKPSVLSPALWTWS